MQLNNREISLLIWIALFIAFILSKKSLRQTLQKSIPSLLRALFAWKLSIIYMVIILYNFIVLFLLYRNGFWDESQLKNTIVWLLTAIVVSMTDITNDETSNYFKQTVADVFKFTIIIEFLVGLYSFSLIAELFIVPIAILIPLLIAVGKKEEKFKPAVGFLNSILVIGGAILVVYAVYKSIKGFSAYATESMLTEFLIAPVLSFLFLPCVYLLSLIVNMETAFIPIKFSVQNKSTLRYARWKAVRHFAFNKNSLFRWKQLVLAQPPTDKHGIDRTIQLFKEMKQRETRPEEIDPAEGWPPQKAKDFLVTEGLKTKYYQLLYQQEWQASSNSLELEDSAFSSTAHYAVRGSSTVVSRLTLKLNVYFPTKAKNPHGKFTELVSHLYKMALGEELPTTIKKNILNGKNTIVKGNGKQLSLVKNKWVNHRFNGYDLELVIKVAS